MPKPSEEKLLFQAADAASEAKKVCRALWDGNAGLPLAQVDRLAAAARRLSAAASALQGMASGAPQPKVGD